VTFIKVLTIYHSWIHPLPSFSFIPTSTEFFLFFVFHMHSNILLKVLFVEKSPWLKKKNKGNDHWFGEYNKAYIKIWPPKEHTVINCRKRGLCQHQGNVRNTQTSFLNVIWGHWQHKRVPRWPQGLPASMVFLSFFMIQMDHFFKSKLTGEEFIRILQSDETSILK
jgi:hypothetical protein